MKIIFIYIILFNSFIFANTNLDKYLSSQDRAEVHLEELVSGGYLDKAKVFSKHANSQYPNNETLLCWSGKLYIEVKDLDKAEQYFMKVLALDPTHEIAQMQLKQIKENKKINSNDVVKKLLAYIYDKGSDFLMIFLAFLGSEIISKRYNICQKNSIKSTARRYINRNLLHNSYKARLNSLFQDYKDQPFFSFCFFINFLIISTITFAIIILWIFIVFYYNIDMLVYGNILTINSDSMGFYLSIVFILSFIFVLFIRILIEFLSISNDKIVYELEFVRELELLFNNSAYKEIYFVFKDLKKNKITKIEIKELLTKYGNNSVDILKIYDVD